MMFQFAFLKYSWYNGFVYQGDRHERKIMLAIAFLTVFCVLWVIQPVVALGFGLVFFVSLFVEMWENKR
jgi:hypothetical protein